MDRLFAFNGMLAIAVALTFGHSSASAVDAKALEKWKKDFNESVLPIIQSRCIECHRGEDADGEFDLAKFPSGEEVAKQMGIWERVGKRVRLKEMPPEGSPQLNDEQKSAFHRWLDSQPKEDLCSQIANEETQAWYRGVVMSRRLTRTEYLNAVRDATGVAVDPRFEIPSDGAGGEGFDTNGDSLFTSPIHVEQYLAVAADVIGRAIADPASTENAPLQLTLPGKAADGSELSAEQAARATLGRFARRAWRRPIADEEVDRLMQLFAAVQADGKDYKQSIAEPLKAVLLSPNFMFVVESESAEGGVQRLTPHQLAMRLSLFLWSSIPDEQLLARADAGELDTPEQIIAETRRMLDDPKARYLGENFGLQWININNLLTNIRPDAEVYPEYNRQLAEDLREEAILTIANVFREDRSLLELIDAPYVYANDRIAKHYGLNAADGADWQPLDTGETGRGGVLTLGATLMATSYPRRTSPVLRGRWLLEDILGSRVPPPPPGVPALEAAETEKVVSLRERLEIHRKNPECASCHNRMDPLGFGLENFDALGRWRESENGFTIDAGGKLPSGESFTGPSELKKVVLKRSHDFEKHFVKKLLGFALGRGLNKFDQCVIEDCMKALKEQDHRAAAIIETIVVSYPFQHRYFKAAE
ncbi:hypothetical protein CA51_12050 [Rosistilla oblonga]|uniref:DUF1592 domain-containing protein n=1 Tax=Rosistilla oblonga TaxID=2527990 RepID=UPI001189EBCB|nr:DUF1592 domain-containing protein [Rosistilla oblonga]QDV11343.1 hypothetical protein CA51_12050 [Rosistilla oblonga]